MKSELTTSSSRTQYDPGAVLCTVDQTFEIRQVQSSNILYILHPSQHEVENRADLSAIAQCHGLLELIPKRSDVVQHLRSKVPVYDARYASEKSKDGVTITDVIVDSPFSVTEIHNGLRELCAFEFCGFCWVPTAKDMKDIWLAFMNAMTVEGISIDKELDIHHADSLILEEGYSASIFKAVLGRVSHGDDHNDRASIDPGKCVTWLGSILLETDGENSVQKETFVSRWRDHLPEAWRPNVNLDILKVSLIGNEPSNFVVTDGV